MGYYIRGSSCYSVLAAILLAAALAVIAVSLHRDYGISWDEPVQRGYGETVYAYAFEGDESLLSDRHRVYGPVFEVFLVMLEKGLGLEDLRDVFFMRHLVTFLMFSAGVVIFFLLGKRVLADWRLGVLGAVLLVLTPRIFAHAFYNSKDIPFMAMFVVCMYTLILYLDIGKWWVSLLHGVCCAVLVDLRIIGIIIPVMTLGFFTYLLAGKKAASAARGSRLLNFGTFCAAFLPLTVLLWPTLWTNPVGNFIEAFGAMRKFAWRATVLFMGKEVWSTELPPYYTAVWIVITLPVMYVILGVTGLFVAVVRLAGKDLGISVKRRDALIVLVWLVVPLGFLIVSGAVLYDTWRHTFFVYPAILLLGMMALRWRLGFSHFWIPGLKVSVCALALIVALAVNVALTAFFMIRSHPHENVHFNAFVGGVSGASGKYEMDYWGLSYRALLESLLEKDRDAAIAIYSLNEPGYYNSFMLSPEERSRLEYTDRPADARYYVTNHRWERLKPPEDARVASVEIDGVSLSTAYRMR